jgi:hypothetical protein
METGRQPISLAGRVLAARVVGSRGLEPELARVAAPELAPVQVAVQAPVLVQGVAELEHARVEAELERGLGVVEPEPGPVAEELVLAPAAELATDQPHGHLAVLAETKSVTTAHRPDLVPLLAGEEDLAAAAAETTREPVAAVAVIAWAAAE